LPSPAEIWPAQKTAPHWPARAGECGAYIGQKTARLPCGRSDSIQTCTYFEQQPLEQPDSQVEQVLQESQQRRQRRRQQASDNSGKETATTVKANTKILTSFMTNPTLTLDKLMVNKTQHTNHCLA
jgi:hypothetical protein